MSVLFEGSDNSSQLHWLLRKEKCFFFKESMVNDRIKIVKKHISFWKKAKLQSDYFPKLHKIETFKQQKWATETGNYRSKQLRTSSSPSSPVLQKDLLSAICHHQCISRSIKSVEKLYLLDYKEHFSTASGRLGHL
jgi:hypothetical protein